MKSFSCLGFLAAFVPLTALALVRPARPPLPDFDQRLVVPGAPGSVSEAQARAADELRRQGSAISVDFDGLTGSPRMISARDAFLTGRIAAPGLTSAVATNAYADPRTAAKSFILDHSALFGFGPELLDQARVDRDFVTAHNGLRTVVWTEQVDGVPVFEAVLLAHTTAFGELVNLSCQFIPDPRGAADRGVSNRLALVAAPNVPAGKAVAIAAGTVGEDTPDAAVVPAPENLLAVAGNESNSRLQFQALGLLGIAEASLVWLPMSRDRLRLCWDVILTGRSRGEMFRVLVDAESGQPQVRRCLTEHISDVSYRIYTSDSPSPRSPGYATPVTNQPALVGRVLVTLPALDTNASPSGWIDDGGNETRGNNVDAHTDRDNNNVADLPRPQGSPSRVFDILLNITKDPTNYSAAAVVQLFYWSNWMHDKLYALGFTEAAGNFQSNNFSRGGLGNDAVQADAQDGGNFNNANFSTPPDGSAPRMQMYLWNGPSTHRDGDLDAEIILHEYTHGLSNRRVGGGVGITGLQTRGMGEGWSDFYALTLLSEAEDDVNGTYAEGAYSTYRLAPNFLQNYYFGIRRYPYTTDLSKNPLTLNDIDPLRADHCLSGAPYSDAVAGSCATAAADEVHNQGEVWCVTLWEARARLVTKLGWAAGNQLILQLVTDGMNLSPANPTFLQARDAIIQADLVDTGGTNRNDLWAAFAKRGMGVSATCPVVFTTTGVHEAFDVPGDLRITPAAGLASSGVAGGPFTPSCQVYSLVNTGASTLDWSAATTQPWASASPAGGSLAPGETNLVSVCLTVAANALGIGSYDASVIFSNASSGLTQVRSLNLAATPPRVLSLPLDADPGWTRQGQWAFGQPAGLGGSIHGRPDPTSGATGTNVFGYNLGGDYPTTVGPGSYLTAGPFNFGGVSNARLQFQRWLNADYPPFVYATVDVSTNGTAWSPIWTNGPGETADSAWSRVVYDISAFADNQPSVFVRWGHRVAQSGANAYSGWNIDDVEFLGTRLLDHFAWNHIPSPQVVNVPFLVTVRAQNATNGTVDFSGTVTLTATNGPVPMTPTISANFVQGVWTGAVAVAQSVPNLVLVADDGQGHLGMAEPINFVEAPTLTLTLVGTNLSLYWPGGAPALILETSDSLAPASWLPVASPPTQVGDQFILQVGVPDPQRFYRLRYSP